ncbi:MAG: hypothetical protein H7Y17_08480 [Chlorobia bacterium]|nr:hypothetical protein [Fimbriimonadaceae bacterium]
MTKLNRPWLFFASSFAALAACTVMVGMNNHTPEVSAPDPVVSKVFSSKELAAAETLKSELNRRFTDRQNVDFGMSRVVRKDWRMHYGPTMEKSGQWPKEKTRPLPNGRYEFEVDGVWFKMDERKPLMSAENDSEKQAIDVLKDSGVDVALYTVGQFELDNGTKPSPGSNEFANANPNYRDFSYGTYTTIRAKGPAYISQKSQMAPRAWEVVDFGRKAWASNKADFSEQGKDGWIYMAHRVDAPDLSCAKCHGDRKMPVNGQREVIKGSVQKSGDPVGLFIIAMKKG